MYILYIETMTVWLIEENLKQRHLIFYLGIAPWCKRIYFHPLHTFLFFSTTADIWSGEGGW